MSLRYLAIAGPAPAREQIVGDAQPACCGLVCRYAGRSLEVWAEASAPVLAGAEGNYCLLGVVHDRSTGQRLTTLPDWASSADAMVRDLWGGYAVLVEREDGHAALRDPSGSVPIYVRRDDECAIYASDEELLLRSCATSPSADLGFIQHWLTFPYLRSERTGCIGVREVLPGQFLTIRDGQLHTRQIWSPARCAGHSPVLDFAESATLLREELLRCIPRSLGDTGRAVLKLSGGLDSSLIALALAAAGRTFTAINFATRDPDGDERTFARAVAAACGVELIEMREDAFVVETADRSRSRLRPPRHAMLRGLDKAYAAWWTALRAEAVIDGAGGDNVFAYLNTAAPVLDAWHCEGAAGVIGAIRDLTGIHGGTFWEAAGFAWRKARRGTTTRWPANADFLKLEAVIAAPEPHPWLTPPDAVRPGAREHVRSIVGVHSFLADPQGGEPARFHPLLAQPIVELCLRIPTHLWNRGGRDRAVARAAFADLLPAKVAQRQHKSALGGMFRARFGAIVPELADFIGKGRLVDAGIVDRHAIAYYLTSPNLWAGYNTTRLLEIAAAEQWLRSFD